MGIASGIPNRGLSCCQNDGWKGEIGDIGPMLLLFMITVR
jgi:hypothetical protein